jgi:hypothetical protein
MSQSQTAKTESTYKTIIERLISEIKEEALNEGCNEDMLKELKIVTIYLNNKFLFF